MNDSSILLALEHGWLTRPELCKMLGGVSDRKARAYIEDLNTQLMEYGKCIVSTLGKAGYHIPDKRNPEDMELVRCAIAELKSKAVSIFERRQVLEAFLRLPADTTPQPTQLSLF